MRNGQPKSAVDGSFEEIEAAVRETERGRWFLDEFARRKGADTSELLAALRRIEHALVGRHHGPGAALTSRFAEAREAMPQIMAAGGRLAAETIMATEVLDSLCELAPEQLATSGSRLALATETRRLKELASEQRDVYARLKDCASSLEAMEAELLHEITHADAAAHAENPASAKYFVEDAHLFDAPEPPAPPPPQQPTLKLVATKETSETATTISVTKDAPAFGAGEKRRIVILRGNAQPPMPQADEQPAITA